MSEIERALQERRIDLAVHSLKDLPTAQPEGLCIVVPGPREDVRDVLVSRKGTPPNPKHDHPGSPDRLAPDDRPDSDYHSVPKRIGTCSLRRTAQIRALYPHAEILPLRGNVNTRLSKLDAGDYDAIVLAAAGLHRLGLQEHLVDRLTYLPIEIMMPAPGQGALAMEIRDELEMHALLAPLSDPAVQAATSAERMFMRRLGAGCYLPVAAYAQLVDAELTLTGLIISADGQHQVRVHQSISWSPETGIESAEQLGVKLAEQALAQGADEIISTIEPLSQKARTPLQGKRILVTRTHEQAHALVDRLRTPGAIPVEFPTIQIVPPLDWTPLDDALRRLCATNTTEQSNRMPGQGNHEERPYTWLVFTSANGVRSCFDRLLALGFDAQTVRASKVRTAAIGPATAAALARYGITADLVPAQYVAEHVAAALIEDARRRGEPLVGRRILLARAAEARKVLVTELQQAGAIVDEVAAYRTVTAQGDDEQGREVLRLLQTHQLDILTFTSSSTVRNFMQWLMDCSLQTEGTPTDLVIHNPQLKIACIGPITSQTARELGLDVHIEAKEFTIDGLVEAIVQHEGAS